MSGYLYDPTEPLPKRWKDKIGPIRLMSQPIEGYVMVRRPGNMPFVVHVRDLLEGLFDPIMPSPRINVRVKLDEIKAKQMGVGE